MNMKTKLPLTFHCMWVCRKSNLRVFFPLFRSVNWRRLVMTSYIFPPLTSVTLVGHIWLGANIMNFYSYCLKSHRVYERTFIVLWRSWVCSVRSEIWWRRATRWLKRRCWLKQGFKGKRAGGEYKLYGTLNSLWTHSALHVEASVGYFSKRRQEVSSTLFVAGS